MMPCLSQRTRDGWSALTPTALSPAQGHKAPFRILLSAFVSAPLCLPWWLLGQWQSCPFLPLSRLHLGSPSTLFAGHSHGLLSFSIPSSLAGRLLSHVAWFLLARVSPRLILGICWLWSLFGLWGSLSLRLCLLLPTTLPGFPLFSKSAVGHPLSCPFDLLALLCRGE